MRYSEVLKPAINDVLPQLKGSSDAELVDLVWLKLLEMDAFQGFGAGDRLETMGERH